MSTTFSGKCSGAKIVAVSFREIYLPDRMSKYLFLGIDMRTPLPYSILFGELTMANSGTDNVSNQVVDIITGRRGIEAANAAGTAFKEVFDHAMKYAKEHPKEAAAAVLVGGLPGLILVDQAHKNDHHK
jgi:hypothetical protein